MLRLSTITCNGHADFLGKDAHGVFNPSKIIGITERETEMNNI